MNSARKPSIAIILTLAALGLISACQRSHMSMGSESHFLLHCSSDVTCGPLSCISGTCTAPCDSNNQCTRLAPEGVCLATADMQSTAVPFACGVSCADDAALCSAMSPDLTCRNGQCLPATAGTMASATPAHDAGTSLPQTGAGSGGSGTTAIETPPGTVPAPLGALDPSIISVPTHCGMTPPFSGEGACLAPPDPALGIQIHIGPRNYEDPAEVQAWTLQPGDEVTDCWSFTMPNGSAASFAEWEFSARQGLHAAFFGIDAAADRTLICGVNIEESAHEPRAGVLVAQQERIARRPIATGSIPDLDARAHAPGEVAVHTFNFTNLPELRELWLNLYYANAGTVPANP
jgi:hypothetical protein